MAGNETPVPVNETVPVNERSPVAAPDDSHFPERIVPADTTELLGTQKVMGAGAARKRPFGGGHPRGRNRLAKPIDIAVPKHSSLYA